MYIHQRHSQKLDIRSLGDLTNVSRHRHIALSRTLLDDVFNEGFTGFVRTPNEWPAGTIEETHVEGTLTPSLEYGWSDVFVDFHVALSGLHVLTKGHDVGVDLAKFYARNINAFSEKSR